MPVLEPHALSLIIRWAHLAAMAVALGGAVLVSALVFTRRSPAGAAVAVAAAAGYERLFWGAAGVLVMTGIGNLGAFGRGLPFPATGWGETFVVKLWGVVALLAISLPRSLIVLRVVSSPATVDALGILRRAYGATVALLAIIVAVAELLAH